MRVSINIHSQKRKRSLLVKCQIHCLESLTFVCMFKSFIDFIKSHARDFPSWEPVNRMKSKRTCFNLHSLSMKWSVIPIYASRAGMPTCRLTLISLNQAPLIPDRLESRRLSIRGKALVANSLLLSRMWYCLRILPLTQQFL